MDDAATRSKIEHLTAEWSKLADQQMQVVNENAKHHEAGNQSALEAGLAEFKRIDLLMSRNHAEQFRLAGVVSPEQIKAMTGIDVTDPDYSFDEEHA